MTAVEDLRAKAAPIIIALLLAVCAGAGITAWAMDTNAMLVSLGAGALSLSAILSWRASPTGALTRSLVTVCSCASVGLVLIALEGHAYIVDAHMAFFAVLAVSVLWACWRAIFWGAATVAVQSRHARSSNGNASSKFSCMYESMPIWASRLRASRNCQGP